MLSVVKYFKFGSDAGASAIEWNEEKQSLASWWITIAEEIFQ